MNRHLAGMLLLALCAGPLCGQAAQKRPPNIIVILADDLGWGDLGCYGHPVIRTPHLDRMAREGMRCTDFYSAAEVCTPSRAALLTGRYPVRNGMCHDKFRVLRNNSAGGLPDTEVTLAQLLRGRGYATACIGKWHLGHLPHYLPTRRGFDRYFGMPYSNDMKPAPDAPKGRPRFFEENNAHWRTPLIRNETIVEEAPDQRQLTRRYTDEALAFIAEHKDRPFFLYLPHTFPHVPLFASKDFRGKSPAGIYGDVVEELDANVGRILDYLRQERLDKDTLVVFTSDNGPWLIFDQHGGSAGPLREGKGSTWEGGMRVAGIFWWPGRIPAGPAQQQVACTMDLFATGVKLAGAELPRDRSIDGIDLSPLLFGGGAITRPPYFFYRGQQLYAVRLGPWKVHYITRSAYGPDGPQTHDPPLVYHLGSDPGERFNVAAQHPEVVAEAARAVAQHRATLQPVASQLEAVVK
jgi:arylsulfatase A